MKGRIDIIDVVQLIGTIDRCISEMLVMAANIYQYDEPDRQTLKHHAEDCVAAGNKVLDLLHAMGAFPYMAIESGDVNALVEWADEADNDGTSAWGPKFTAAIKVARSIKQRMKDRPIGKRPIEVEEPS